MITKTFICDVCKKSVGETELCQVEANVKVPRQDNCRSMKSVSTKFANCDKDVCKDCLVKKGILIELSEDDKERANQVASNQKTLESKLIDILSDLGVLFEE